jgi:cation diffusion facilitator CzcD-associated flavoprotein CzcO
MKPRETDVVIVGSGPYALSLATHLRARGVEFRIFGPAMQFWRDMPRGINLKSFAFASNVYTAERGYGFQEWCLARGLEDYEPCTMADFAAYGVWVQERLVPNLEPTRVRRVSVTGDERFEVALETEERVRARRVVFATGLSDLDYTPEALLPLGPDLVTHTSTHPSYARFTDKDVAIVGAGASSVEAGALVHEAGGRPRVLVREREIVFSQRAPRHRPLHQRIRYPQSVLGQGSRNWTLDNVPYAIYFVPEKKRVRFAKTYLGPVAPWWIKDRYVGKVPTHLRANIVAAERVGDRARLRIAEQGKPERTIEVDHVVAGTGYVYDVDKLSYLDGDFRARIRRLEKAPALSVNFESSVKGAYFLGPIATLNFGPLLRFVSGAKFAAPAVARHIAGPAREVTSTLRRWTGAVGAAAT